MRPFRIISLVILFLIIAVLAAWFILYYIVWPKPQLIRLVPDNPFAYISASNLKKTASTGSINEFINRFFKSPTWESFKLTPTGQKIISQKNILERNLGKPVDINTVMQILGKDIFIAFYNNNEKWDFLLTSQVGVIVRFELTFGFTKHTLESEYKLVGEKYKGIDLSTLKVMDEDFSYAFIGQAGMLSTDISLLKRAIDAYKDDGNGLSENPEFRKLTAGLLGNDLAFYVDSSRIDEVYNYASQRRPSTFRFLLSLADQFDELAGFGSQELGNLKFDLRLKNIKTEGQTSNNQNTIRNFVPDDCIFFLQNNDMKPDKIFDITKDLLGLDLDVIKYLLFPALGDGVSLAVLKPRIQEFQFTPPIITVFKIKDKESLESALTIIKKSLIFGQNKLEFSQIEYEGIDAFHANLNVRRGYILEPGYTIIDDFLIIGTYKSVLKDAIEVYKDKRQPILKNENYLNILKSITPFDSALTNGNMFLDIESLSSMTKQVAKMNEIQAKLMGVKSAELSAIRLYQNVNLLEIWRYMGAAFSPENGNINMKLILIGGAKNVTVSRGNPS